MISSKLEYETNLQFRAFSLVYELNTHKHTPMFGFEIYYEHDTHSLRRGVFIQRHRTFER
jgi:hypothetical protein